MTNQITNREWSIDALLSDFMNFTSETDPKERAEIWASDIGKSFLDRYLSMKAHPYSNPIDGKTLMTFFLGKQIELGLTEMLKTCNLTFQAQDRLEINVPGCLPVVGRPDLLMEVSDWDIVIKNIDNNIKEILAENLDDAERQVKKKNVLKKIVEEWRIKYPNGLEKTPFEIKTINTNAFNYFCKSKDGFKNANPHYQMQLYTYMRYYNSDKGRLVYVSKNDGKIVEVVIHKTAEIERKWLEDIKTMSYYYYNSITPPCEQFKIGKKDNWKIAYSRYKDYLHKNYKNNQGML